MEDVPSSQTISTVQTPADVEIFHHTRHLKPYKQGSPQILFKALQEYGLAYSAGQCNDLLANSKSLYEKLVEAHSTRCYQDLVYATKALIQSSLAPTLTSAVGPFPEPHPSAATSPSTTYDYPSFTPDPSVVHTSTPASTKIPLAAQAVIERILPALWTIVAPDWKWETWKPSVPDDDSIEKREIYSWLSELEIPLLNGQPNLLLHGLGNFQNDPGMRKRLSAIFKHRRGTFLVNTSGTGKTRHVLEGLCRDWGFYFCSTTQSEAFGSRDIMHCIESRLLATEGFIPKLPSGECADQLTENCRIASDCFFQVVLARCLVFTAFLTCIIDSGRKITEEDKRRWVLLQVKPSLLTPSPDIFNELAQVLNDEEMSTAVCKLIISTLLEAQAAQISQYSETPKSPTEETSFYCVLDEAQYAARELPFAFRSSRFPDISRAVLRELIVVLAFLVRAGYGLAVTGTGVDKALIDEPFESVISKHKKYEWTPKTGSFDKKTSSQLQEAYIRRYVPPTILVSVVGERLIERMADWLEGRFRLTASFLANLLQSDLKNPHQFLNDWVAYNTNFRPTDAPEYTSPTCIYKTFSTTALHEQLNFPRFNSEGAPEGAIALLTKAVYDSLLRGHIPGKGLDEIDDLLVETGFGRCHDADLPNADPCLKEPIILLAATHYMENVKDNGYESLWQYVKRSVGNKTSSENNGFETYTAFLLAHALATPTVLKDIFEFPKSVNVPPWAHQTARLVSISQDSNSGERFAYEFNWPTRAISSAWLGMPFSARDSVEWLNHRHRHKPPFFFPGTNMGPDILFVLELENKRLIWVSMQLKFHASGIYGEDLLDAVCTTVPQCYWVTKPGAHHAVKAYPTLVKDTLAALKALPGPTDMGKPYPLLRVLAGSTEAVITIERLDAITKDNPLHDPGKHPLCGLNWEYLIKNHDKTWFLKRVIPKNYIRRHKKKDSESAARRERLNSAVQHRHNTRASSSSVPIDRYLSVLFDDGGGPYRSSPFDGSVDSYSSPPPSTPGSAYSLRSLAGSPGPQRTPTPRPRASPYPRRGRESDAGPSSGSGTGKGGRGGGRGRRGK
ncbi:hypothetical protein DFH09DRAFT_1178829 [Mycena vulgaris]|nr:hypothetical protein DFH09DRAFT_1178829 [Mycena vulgaris]